jgi:RND superfamily putative drug exporter
MFQYLARLCYRRRRAVVATWLLLLVGLLTVSRAAGGTFNNRFDLPGSESKAAFDLLKQTGFNDRAGFSGQIVFRADQGVDDPAVRAAMLRLFAGVEQAASNVRVVDPYGAAGARQVSADRHIAYAEVDFADRATGTYQTDAKHITSVVDRVKLAGLRVQLGGDIFANQTFNGQEGIGFLAAIFILLIAFGSILAMGLPVLTALFGIGCGIALVEIAANVVVMPNFTTQAAAMIGIGVGIDYALFIVTRYRQALHDGRSPADAVVLAMDTAGRAVLFAGTTVAISLLGLLVVGLAIPRGVGIGAAMAVVTTMLASLTLLPAVLGFVGHTIDRFGLPHRGPAQGGGRESLWYRWSRVIQRRPVPAALAGLAVLVALALPVFSLRLGFSDAGSRPTRDTTRQAYDMLSQAFGAGFNGPLLVAARTPGGAADLATMARLSDELRRTPGVAFTTPPVSNPAGTAALMQVFPTTAPQDVATNRLVRHLRSDVVPNAVAGSQLHPKIGGITAASVDFAHFTGRRMPVFMGAVLALPSCSSSSSSGACSSRSRR